MVGRGGAARRDAFKASLLASAAWLAPGPSATVRRLSSGYNLFFLAARAAPAAALALLWLPGEARAVCTPASPVSNADVTCTGTTVNQNAATGYGGFGDTGNTITAVPGASVTGTANGIVFFSGAVANSGTVSGGTADGISADTANVSNSGTISGGIHGVNANATVTNSGTISGGTGQGITGDTSTVSNSGTITGGSNGIAALTGIATTTVTNSGTISGGTADGIAAGTANVTNFGTITGAIFGIDATATANVTNSGTISGGTDGIAATTANVTNSGTISGSLSDGIDATAIANVTNSGTISGSAFGRGIQSTGGSTTVTNSGTISGGLGGISVGGDATVTNSGTILGGAGAAGIAAGTATVSNSGTISGGITGILGNAAATVSNSGTISGQTGINADFANVTNSGTISGGLDGIFSSNTANVSNSGTISGARFGISTFFALGSANVSNSGIISGGTAALQFSGNPDTLTLLPGSTIIGAINLGGGGDTVNFRTGNQNLTFDTLAGATVTSGHPFVVVGNRVVTIDPTSFALTDRTLMDFTRGLSAAIPDINNVAATGGAPLAFAAPAAGNSAADRIGDAFAAIPGLAYAGEAEVFKSPTAVYGDGTAIWARGFAGRRVQEADGVASRTTNAFYGGMLGADRQVTPNLRLGIFGGGGETRSDFDRNAGESNSTLLFGGAYARWRVANAFLDVATQAGHSSNDTSRNNINNNLAPGGFETAKAKFDGWYVNPEAHVGVHLPLGTASGVLYTLTPSARVRYLHASFDGYTETGSTANMTVGSRTAQNLEERGELKLTMTQGTVSTSVYGGLLGVQRLGDTTINASLLGQPLPFATPGDDIVWGGYGGLGIAWRNAAGLSFFGAVEYTALSDQSRIVSGQGGVRVAF